MEPTSTELQSNEVNPLTFTGRIKRKAAAGKALLVYLGTGSIGAAIIAYLVFHSMGC